MDSDDEPEVAAEEGKLEESNAFFPVCRELAPGSVPGDRLWRWGQVVELR